MKTSATALLLFASLFLSAPAQSETTKQNTENQQILRQANEIEWSLKHSSMAERISINVMDKSISLLKKARAELAAGHKRTAEDLINLAATPLYEMSDAARNGRHPDHSAFLTEQRETLQALIEGTIPIARQKGASLAFAESAQQAVSRSLTLEKQGNIDEAQQVIAAAYTQIQKTVATLRNGDSVYLAIAELPPDRQWLDGLRRFEERRQLTEYLITEARAGGIDPSPLHSGLQSAELAKAAAVDWANDRHWDQAIKSLDLAYLKFEDSWRQVGLEW